MTRWVRVAGALLTLASASGCYVATVGGLAASDAGIDARTIEAAPCSEGLSVCSGGCVDLLNDRDHCGTCDHACAGTCTQGVCVGDVGPDIPIAVEDAGHCTMDGDCAGGRVCTGGVCVAGADASTSCTAGRTRCDAVCVDTATDPDHCGACTTICAVGETCSAGVCARSATDASVIDAASCHGDGDCAPGETCVANVCRGS